MARIVEEKIIVVLSRVVKSSDENPEPVLDSEQLETLQQAVEGLVNNEAVVVELVAN